MFQVLSTAIPAVALIYGAQKDKDCGGLIDLYETEKKSCTLIKRLDKKKKKLKKKKAPDINDVSKTQTHERSNLEEASSSPLQQCGAQHPTRCISEAGRRAKSPITEIKRWWWFGGSIHHHVGVFSFWRQQGSILEGCSEAQPINDEVWLRKTQRSDGSDGLVSKPARQSSGQRPSVHRHRRRWHASGVYALCRLVFSAIVFQRMASSFLEATQLQFHPPCEIREHTTRLRLTTAHPPPKPQLAEVSSP